MRRMGVLFDYFAAASDDEAATAVDRVAGPGSDGQDEHDEPTPKRRGLFRRRAEPAPHDTERAQVLEPFDTVHGFVDPVVQLGTLEELLTGRPYDDVVDDPRSGHVVADRDGGERLVVTLTDALTTALREASDDRLAEVAEPWLQTEEFWDEGDPDVAAEFLRRTGTPGPRPRTPPLLLDLPVAAGTPAGSQIGAKSSGRSRSSASNGPSRAESEGTSA